MHCYQKKREKRERERERKERERDKRKREKRDRENYKEREKKRIDEETDGGKPEKERKREGEKKADSFIQISSENATALLRAFFPSRFISFFFSFFLFLFSFFFFPLSAQSRFLDLIAKKNNLSRDVFCYVSFCCLVAGWLAGFAAAYVKENGLEKKERKVGKKKN